MSGDPSSPKAGPSPASGDSGGPLNVLRQAWNVPGTSLGVPVGTQEVPQESQSGYEGSLGRSSGTPWDCWRVAGYFPPKGSTETNGSVPCAFDIIGKPLTFKYFHHLEVRGGSVGVSGAPSGPEDSLGPASGNFPKQPNQNAELNQCFLQPNL